MSGAAGPCGVTKQLLKNWCCRHDAHSEALRAELGEWTEWLANGSPPYAAYRAMICGRELPSEKNPGVRPLNCGEIWMRLMTGCTRAETRTQATEACGNVQLCAGLKGGIEGCLHAIRAICLSK